MQLDKWFSGVNRPGLIEAQYLAVVQLLSGSFPGLIAPASLKRGVADLHLLRESGFPGLIAPASLKHLDKLYIWFS